MDNVKKYGKLFADFLTVVRQSHEPDSSIVHLLPYCAYLLEKPFPLTNNSGQNLISRQAIDQIYDYYYYRNRYQNCEKPYSAYSNWQWVIPLFLQCISNYSLYGFIRKSAQYFIDSRMRHKLKPPISTTFEKYTIQLSNIIRPIPQMINTKGQNIASNYIKIYEPWPGSWNIFLPHFNTCQNNISYYFNEYLLPELVKYYEFLYNIIKLEHCKITSQDRLFSDSYPQMDYVYTAIFPIISYGNREESFFNTDYNKNFKTDLFSHSVESLAKNGIATMIISDSMIEPKQGYMKDFLKRIVGKYCIEFIVLLPADGYRTTLKAIIGVTLNPPDRIWCYNMRDSSESIDVMIDISLKMLQSKVENDQSCLLSLDEIKEYDYQIVSLIKKHTNFNLPQEEIIELCSNCKKLYPKQLTRISSNPQPTSYHNSAYANSYGGADIHDVPLWRIDEEVMFHLAFNKHELIQWLFKIRQLINEINRYISLHKIQKGFNNIPLIEEDLNYIDENIGNLISSPKTYCKIFQAKISNIYKLLYSLPLGFNHSHKQESRSRDNENTDPTIWKLPAPVHILTLGVFLSSIKNVQSSSYGWGICILDSLSGIDFMQTLNHELAHAYMYNNKSKIINCKWIEEGLADYLAFEKTYPSESLQQRLGHVKNLRYYNYSKELINQEINHPNYVKKLLSEWTKCQQPINYWCALVDEYKD